MVVPFDMELHLLDGVESVDTSGITSWYYFVCHIFITESYFLLVRHSKFEKITSLCGFVVVDQFFCSRLVNVETHSLLLQAK